MDLRDYLTKKWSAHQITPHCCCEQLIIAVLSECHCSSYTNKQSVFKMLSVALVSRSAKRRCSHKKKTFSDMEYPKVTANMVRLSTTSSRAKGKQPLVNSDQSDAEPEGVYQYTRTQTGTISPVNYSALAQGIELSEAYSAIAELQASNSFREREAFAYMVSTPDLPLLKK